MTRRKKILLIAGLAGFVVAVVVWATTRETATQKKIKETLAALRASGEPVDAQDLARMFPDPGPEEDAEILFAKAFEIATNRPAPGSTPLVMSGTIARTEAINEVTLQQLTDFFAATAAITNAFPTNVPPNARFAMRWDQGMTNAGTMNFLRVRHFIQFLAAHVVAAVEVGDAERATVMMEQGFAFTRTVNYDGLFSAHMIRHACEGLMCTVTERALNRARFNDTQLRRISSALRMETPEDWRNCCRAEHCFAIWVFQAVRDGMPAEVFFGRPPASTPWWERTWDKIRRRGVPDYSDEDFLAYLQAIPLRLRLGEVPPLMAIREAERLRDGYRAKAVSEVGAVLPAPNGPSMAGHAETQARMTLLAVALGVERARLAQTNEIPQSLGALVPQYLPTVPLDPFDAQPLRFKRLSQGYVVYSIGRDGVDDGGTERSNMNVTTNSDVTIIVER